MHVTCMIVHLMGVNDYYGVSGAGNLLDFPKIINIHRVSSMQAQYMYMHDCVDQVYVNVATTSVHQH